ncbi:MAG TPA: DEAD/DEAH box helicase [Thermotogota bacterium]|nr:DEAD/DEAH box helicase [Thermotogota bacterium]
MIDISNDVDCQVGKTLFKDMGWRGLRQLQDKAYKQIIEGKNALLTAGTASGKTEAALLPVLSTLLSDEELYNSQTPLMIYIAPLKALINDIYLRLKKLTSRTTLKTYCWHGDISQKEKNLALKSASIIVTTPESLEGMFISSKIDHHDFFKNLRFVLVDELHALINGPRGAQLASLIERLDHISRYDIQRVAMSATIGNPQQVLEWIQGGSERETVHVDDSKSSRKMIMVRERSLENLKSDIEKMLSFNGKGIIFTSSKQEAEVLNHYFIRNGFRSLLHHGSMGKGIREQTETLFKSSPDYKIMIATTTLEMGIDIGDVAYVFFYSVPKSAASFMQRLGRAGRKTGVAKALIYINTELENEKKLIDEHLSLFANVQLFKDNAVEPIEMIRFYPQLLAHQIISMVLAEKVITFRDIAVLKNAYCFKDIGAADLQTLISHLTEEGFLSIRGNEIRIGANGAALFGGAGAGEFVSVFDAGRSYAVLYNNIEVGQIHYATISSQQKLEGGDFSQRFILAGRAWKVIESDPFKRILKVIPAQKGSKPMWLGKGGEIAERFASAAARFVCTPEFPETIKVDQAVYDALMNTVDLVRTTIDESRGYCPVEIKRKRSMDYEIYTYGGEIRNMLYSLLIPEYFEGVKEAKYDWKRVKFKSPLSVDCDDFFIWLDQVSKEEFEKKLTEKLKEDSKKIGEILFQDRFAGLVGEELLAQTYINILWKILKSEN